MSTTPKQLGVSVCQKCGTVANDTAGYKDTDQRTGRHADVSTVIPRSVSIEAVFRMFTAATRGVCRPPSRPCLESTFTAALRSVNTSLFVAMGKPSNSRYQAVHRSCPTERHSPSSALSQLHCRHPPDESFSMGTPCRLTHPRCSVRCMKPHSNLTSWSIMHVAWDT